MVPLSSRAVAIHLVSSWLLLLGPRSVFAATITILLERWIQSYMEVHTVFMWATEHETY
jgi:hypothetical protein